MSTTQIDMQNDIADAEAAAALLADREAVARDATLRSDLAANADARKTLRKQAEKVELRLAFRDLAEGLRGLVRASPLLAVLGGVVAGMALSRRRGRPRPPTRRG